MMEPKNSAVRRIRRRTVVVAAALATLSAFYTVATQLDSRERAHNPYPRTQKGLTLVSVYHDPTDDRFAVVTLGRRFVGWLQYLWSAQLPEPQYPSITIALPDNAAPLYGAKTPVAWPSGDPVYAGKVSVRASTGDSFVLDDAEFVAVSPQNGRKAAHYGMVHLPKPGVPANYQWMDVTVDDQNGHRGTWRIFEFPRLKHVLSPSAPLHETESVHHILLQARAWWDAQAAPPCRAGDSTISMPVVAEIKAIVPPAALNRPSHLWGIEIVSMMQEWDNPTPYQNQNFGSSGMPVVHSSRPIIGQGISFAQAKTMIAPRPSDQHITRLEAKLTEYDAIEETVTFHNLSLTPHEKGLIVHVPSGGLSQTTPSGVRVSITDLSTRGKSTVLYKPNVVRVLYSLSPNVPRQRHGNSVGKNYETRSFVTSAAFDKSEFSSVINDDPHDNGTPCIHLVLLQPSPHLILNQLTIRISQQTKLQTVPVIFTVPIQTGKPKESWEGL